MSGSSVDRSISLVYVVVRAVVGDQLDAKSSSRPCDARNRLHRVVGREHRRGRAELGAHVGDHVAVHRAQSQRSPGRNTR